MINFLYVLCFTRFTNFANNVIAWIPICFDLLQISWCSNKQREKKPYRQCLTSWKSSWNHTQKIVKDNDLYLFCTANKCAWKRPNIYTTISNRKKNQANLVKQNSERYHMWRKLDRARLTCLHIMRTRNLLRWRI